MVGLTIGVIAGGQLGPLLSNRFSPGQLALLLSLGLAGAGARLIFAAASRYRSSSPGETDSTSPMLSKP